MEHCHISHIVNRGFTLSYGAFQTYYKDTLLSSSSASAISWIGTVQGWLLILVGVLSGPLFDLGYFRPMLYLGNFLVVFGIMMLSLCDRYWQVLLAQGLCMGLGAGLLYIPSLALVGIWFERRRALAMGVVMSGIAVGEWKSFSWGRGLHLHIFDPDGSVLFVYNRMPNLRLMRRRWSRVRDYVRPSYPYRRLSMGYPSYGFYCIICCTPLLPRAPLRFQCAGSSPQGSPLIRQNGSQGSIIHHFYMLYLFHLLRVYRTLFLYTNLRQE